MARAQINMQEFLDICKTYLVGVSVTLEIGALDGNDSVFFKKTFPGARVISIEGLEENFLANRDRLGGAGVESLYHVITDRDGFIDFYEKETNGIHGIYDRGLQYGNKVLRNIPCSRIDTLCSVWGIAAIDFVKIDVEGATFEVLNGFGDMLEKTGILHIETETYPFFKGQRLHQEVSDFLISKNFSMVDCTSVDITKDGKQMDSVWINNKLKKESNK